MITVHKLTPGNIFVLKTWIVIAVIWEYFQRHCLVSSRRNLVNDDVLIKIFFKSRGCICDVMASRMWNWMICMCVWQWQKSVSVLEIFLYHYSMQMFILRYVTTARCWFLCNLFNQIWFFIHFSYKINILSTIFYGSKYISYSYVNTVIFCTFQYSKYTESSMHWMEVEAFWYIDNNRILFHLDIL